jgi:hypothetical protein
MATKKNKLEKKIADHNHKKMVVKICVISISTIIIFLWGFALRNQFVSAEWIKTPEYELIKNAQAQWKSSEEAVILDRTAHDAAYEAAKAKISEIIVQIASNTQQIAEDNEKEISDSATSTTSTKNILETEEQKNSQINED